jgi:hypothetical protein
MTKTAHSDIAGAIKWATARLKRLNDDLVLCEPDRYQKPAWIAERDALTLLIDTVRGYEAMMATVDEIDGNRPDGSRWLVWKADSGEWRATPDDARTGYDAPLAAFRAMAMEGDE